MGGGGLLHTHTHRVTYTHTTQTFAHTHTHTHTQTFAHTHKHSRARAHTHTTRMTETERDPQTQVARSERETEARREKWVSCKTQRVSPLNLQSPLVTTTYPENTEVNQRLCNPVSRRRHKYQQRMALIQRKSFRRANSLNPPARNILLLAITPTTIHKTRNYTKKIFA